MKETHTSNLPSLSSDLEKPTDGLQNSRRLQNSTQLADDAMARFLLYEYAMDLLQQTNKTAVPMKICTIY
jgi:hypothetical protein